MKAHPIIGENFFSDFDIEKDGIINGNQFSRGLSTIYEAIFRSYPSPKEINTLVNAFKEIRFHGADKINKIASSLDMQSITVDYRVFCDVIGAGKNSV